MEGTVSETIFEEFCSSRQLLWERIAEGDKKSPDYYLVCGDERIVTEVKEIQPNEEELESERAMRERGWGNVLGHVPGDRLRLKIAAASKQIKARTQGRHPSLLVVFDQGREIGHVDADNVKAAMYGLQQIDLTVPPIGQGSPYASGTRLGPRRKMTPTDNTSISAVGSLFMPSRSEIKLFVYHNRFAKVPLRTELLAPYGVRQFELAETVPGRAADWREITGRPSG